MWQRLAKFVLKNRFVLLCLLLIMTVWMGFYASKVKLSYEFSRAIPTDNPKYLEYVSFKKIFGDDGNMLVIGVQTKDFFNQKQFTAYQEMSQQIKKVHCVEDVLSVPAAVMLEKDTASERLQSKKIFADYYDNQQTLDSASAHFLNLPF